MSSSNSYVLIGLNEALAQRRKSRAAHYRDVSAGLFPPPVRVGKRAVAWPLIEIERIIAAQVAGFSEDELRSLVKDLTQSRRSCGGPNAR